MTNDEPSRAVRKFLETNVLPHAAILTIKSEHELALNVEGPFILWTIRRTDKKPPIDETVLTRATDTGDTQAGEEPPFHVHVNGWSRIASARLNDHRSDFLRPRY